MTQTAPSPERTAVLQRASRERPCPICGGWPERPSGETCNGLLRANMGPSGEPAVLCDSLVYAGNYRADLRNDVRPPYPHSLGESGCDCGTVHNIIPGPTPPPPPRARSSEPPDYTDLRNSQRLIEVYGQDALYDHTRGIWRIWDSCVWAQDETETVLRMAKRIIADLNTDFARDTQGMDEKEQLRKLRELRACESSGRLRAMVECTRSELHATHETWDQDPWLLNVSNGTIDLRTGDLLPHRPERWQSKLAPVDYDPFAKCPEWDAFLQRIFAGDEETIALVQRGIGLSLVGAVREHVLFMCYGTGRNGKSTLLKAVMGAVGDYGREAAPDLLIQRDMPEHPAQIADLVGVRFATTVEGRGRLDTSKVKALVSGDRLNARFMHQNPFTFTPSHTLWMAVNEKPNINELTEGIWSKVKLIPFTVRIPDEEQRKDIDEVLARERPGILAWAVRGCLEWQKHGLGTSAAVAAATAGYRTEQDTLAGFLEEKCLRGEDYVVSAAEILKEYKSYCEDTGEKPLSQHWLGRRLVERGFGKSRSGQGYVLYTGLRVRQPFEARDIPDGDPLPQMAVTGHTVPLTFDGEEQKQLPQPTRDQFDSDQAYETAFKQWYHAVDKGDTTQ